MVWKPSKILAIGSAIGLTVGGVVLIKDALVGGSSKDKNLRADGKVVIVTGANTGIGKATTRELAKRGATVYMACRSLERCNEARTEIILATKNKNVFCRQCDLADFNSISEFTDQFKKEQQRLDILINNAGVMRTPKSHTKQGIEMQLGVNHMGHFLLTHQLLDTMKASAPSRIVVVASVSHAYGKMNFEDLNSTFRYEPSNAHEQSKLANMLFTRHLAKLLKGSGVTVNAVNPGIANTEITRHMPFAKSTTASVFVKPFLALLLKSPEQAAGTTLHVALDPTLENVSGRYFSDCQEKEPSELAQNDADAARLWAVSERWTINRT